MARILESVRVQMGFGRYICFVTITETCMFYIYIYMNNPQSSANQVMADVTITETCMLYIYIYI